MSYCRRSQLQHKVGPSPEGASTKESCSQAHSSPPSSQPFWPSQPAAPSSAAARAAMLEPNLGNIMAPAILGYRLQTQGNASHNACLQQPRQEGCEQGWGGLCGQKHCFKHIQEAHASAILQPRAHLQSSSGNSCCSRKYHSLCKQVNWQGGPLWHYLGHISSCWQRWLWVLHRVHSLRAL